MKTSHELARELLAGPDLPIYHLDPSLANYGEGEESVTDPKIEVNKAENIDEPEDSEGRICEFITISGTGDISVEQE